MIPGLSKSTLLLSSAPHCDIRLGGPGVAPEHARLQHTGGGHVTFGLTDSGCHDARAVSLLGKARALAEVAGAVELVDGCR